MNRFPSSMTMFVSISLLALFTGFRFINKLAPQHLQLKFDWTNEKAINELDDLKMDSVSYNFLELNNVPTEFEPNNQNTFSLIQASGRKYYFRFINFERNGKVVTLSSVEWLTGVPESSFGKVVLKEVDIPLIKNYGGAVITIGDEFFIKDEAKYFRREIASKSKFDFEGKLKDVFNYKHLASYELNIDKLEKTVENAPEVDFYVIAISPTSEEFTDPNLELRFNKLIENLANRKKTKKIIWIEAPFVTNENQNVLNKKLNQILSKLKNNKLILLDAYSVFKNEKSEYLMPDGIHLNKFGYELLADKTVELLK